ncbi:unnamed protein product [Ilex paraguariensis]|uniref:Uncharacterized protein n=1 Tax=Ilex paraguariensis TaxID=185542 RepID=A0ABC8SNJ1_9AQUA
MKLEAYYELYFREEARGKMKSSIPPLHRSSKVLEEEQRERPAMAAERNPAAKSSATAAQPRMDRKKSEDINESAEAFINKFRQQLMIQRLESIENYEKMLARGT